MLNCLYRDLIRLCSAHMRIHKDLQFRRKFGAFHGTLKNPQMHVDEFESTTVCAGREFNGNLRSLRMINERQARPNRRSASTSIAIELGECALRLVPLTL